MNRKRRLLLNVEDAAIDFLNYLHEEKPQVLFFIPFILVAWLIERWAFSLSNWVPLVLAVWLTIQVLSLLSNRLYYKILKFFSLVCS